MNDGKKKRNGPDASQQTQPGSDVLVAPGLSIHFFGENIGIYSSRIVPGKGFVEMPASDLRAIARHLCDEYKKSTHE